MTIFHSIILGFIEGVTEFLPISSTGHLLLATKLLGIAQSDFAKSFDIIIQLGAIGAVIVLYWKTLWRIETIKKLIVAFIPTGIIGLLLYKIVKTYLLGNERVVLWALLLGGIILIVFEYLHIRQNTETTISDAPDTSVISYKHAFLIGLFQSIAIIPGVSRSAATIVGGRMLGLSRSTIVTFSFLLAVPTMLAASALDIIKHHDAFSVGQAGVIGIGFIVSFVVALVVIRYLLGYIRRHDFSVFGWYRIVLALLFWAFIL